MRRYFQRRFDYVLVDEFQDTDPLQAEIAFLLAEDPEGEPAADWRGCRLKPGKLFVVGDPKQSIYRFRRADIAVYEEAKRLVERSGGETLALTTNFRTVPSIVSFVNERFDEVFADRDLDPDPRPLVALPGRGRPRRRPDPRPRRAAGAAPGGRRPQGRLHRARSSPRPWPRSSTRSRGSARGASATATPCARRARATWPSSSGA